MFLADSGSAYGSLADPPASSVVAAAASWLQGTLLGSVATIVAVIAVSFVGFMMLTGRINVRHGLTVVLGSFILFGASTIVAGLQQALYGSQRVASAQAEPPPPPPIITKSEPPSPASYDPYAGASVPAQ